MGSCRGRGCAAEVARGQSGLAAAHECTYLMEVDGHSHGRSDNAELLDDGARPVDDPPVASGLHIRIQHLCRTQQMRSSVVKGAQGGEGGGGGRASTSRWSTESQQQHLEWGCMVHCQGPHQVLKKGVVRVVVSIWLIGVEDL